MIMYSTIANQKSFINAFILSTLCRSQLATSHASGEHHAGTFFSMFAESKRSNAWRGVCRRSLPDFSVLRNSRLREAFVCFKVASLVPEYPQYASTNQGGIVLRPNLKQCLVIDVQKTTFSSRLDLPRNSFFI